MEPHTSGNYWHVNSYRKTFKNKKAIKQLNIATNNLFKILSLWFWSFILPIRSAECFLLNHYFHYSKVFIIDSSTKRHKASTVQSSVLQQMPCPDRCEWNSQIFTETFDQINHSVNSKINIQNVFLYHVDIIVKYLILFRANQKQQ